MKSAHIDHQFYLSLVGFLMAAKQHVAAVGDELGLTAVQAMTLLLLDERQPLPMKSFCRLYHCDASNVTGIVDGLENKQLVARRSNPHDRRIKVVQLEPAGQKMQQRIVERLDEVSGFMFDPLDEAETQQLVRIVSKIAAAEAPADVFCRLNTARDLSA